MSVGLALEMLGGERGPRGGDVNNPATNPERRRAPFAPAPTTDGSLGLHKPEFKDTASIGRKNEQPWHRMAAYMLLAGRTNSEIALAADVHPNSITQLRAQRFFQELLATLAQDNGQAMKGLVDAEAQDAFQRIVAIATDPEAPMRVALAANQLILEHSVGKPVQKVVSNITHSVSKSPTDEMAEIQQELEVIRRRDANNK